MQYGFVFPGGGARTAADLAYEAEAAGWGGFFVWDSVWGIDPWVTLAAVAMRTERVRIGTMLTQVSRRQPWKLAGETVNLDHLSGGRLILSVGLGATDTGFAEFGERRTAVYGRSYSTKGSIYSPACGAASPSTTMASTTRCGRRGLCRPHPHTIAPHPYLGSRAVAEREVYAASYPLRRTAPAQKE